MGDLYAGMDLHSKNTFVGILEKGSLKRVYEKRFSNDLPVILGELEPFRSDLQGITVESTYNWYWLVDGLMDAGYGCVHLANPSAIQQYKGLKYADDRHDAFWLAQLLSLGILPEGYIYPKEDRPIRDLLRKRSFLVRQRTAHMNSLTSMIDRNTGNRPSANAMRKLKPEDMDRIFADGRLALIAKTSMNAIGFYLENIRGIEKIVRKAVRKRQAFECLHTVPGIGDVLALTIMLEVGEISRFPNVGNFSSYCRCVPSRRISNGKSKGKGNTRNGNRYLSWAFVEAANLSLRCSPNVSRYYQKKSAKTNSIVAIKALSNKLARACYYIIRDGVPFKEDLLFG